MKPMIKLLAAFALLLATFGQPSTASAGDVSTFKWGSVTAYFPFTSIDPSGCLITSATVGGVEERLHTPPGKASTSGLVYVQVSLFNLCTDTRVLNAFGSAPLPTSDLKITGNLSSVTLTTTVNVFDQISGTFFDVFIDLTWRGTGEIIRDRTHDVFNFEGCHFNIRDDLASRSAQASGTISDGTINFTPEPSISATIFAWQGGEVSHGCD